MHFVTIVVQYLWVVVQVIRIAQGHSDFFIQVEVQVIFVDIVGLNVNDVPNRDNPCLVKTSDLTDAAGLPLDEHQFLDGSVVRVVFKAVADIGLTQHRILVYAIVDPQLLGMVIKGVPLFDLALEQGLVVHVGIHVVGVLQALQVKQLDGPSTCAHKQSIGCPVGAHLSHLLFAL